MPDPAAVVAVFDPYAVVVPYSNHQSVAAPLGLTVPFSVADVPPTALTVPVIATGFAAAAPCTTSAATTTTTASSTVGRCLRIARAYVAVVRPRSRRRNHYVRAAAIRASASSGSPAPTRSTTGTAPVRSITVDGVPGSSPPSTAKATPARISAGTSSRRRWVGPAGKVRARRNDHPDACDDLGRRPDEAGNADADRLGTCCREPAVASLAIGDDERERPRQQRADPRGGHALEARDAGEQDLGVG